MINFNISHIVIKLCSILLFISIITVSCQEEIFEDTKNDNRTCIILHLNCQDENSDTRSNKSQWQYGDTLFIAFQNNNTYTIGYGGYEPNSDTWQFLLESNLNSTNDYRQCRIYYFRNKKTISNLSNIIDIDEYTEIFADTAAFYTYDNNDEIFVRAKLTPVTWKLAFRGKPNDKFIIDENSDIHYMSGLDLQNGQFTTMSKSVSAVINEEGYSPNIYGCFFSSNVRFIVKESENSVISYYCNIDSTSLLIGENGYISLPIEDDMKNWTKTYFINSCEYIDLGLPSNLLWSSKNIGAAKPTDIGKYYAWGETCGYGEAMDGYSGGNGSATNSNYKKGVKKYDYSWTYYKWGKGPNTLYKYTHYGTSNANDDNLTSLKNSDDAAACNEGVRMPTKSEMKELIDYCYWEYVDSYEGLSVSGQIIYKPISEQDRGLKNQNLSEYNLSMPHIFIPNGGKRSGTSLVNGNNCYIWTSSRSGDHTKAAVLIDSNLSDIFRYYGCNVRSVSTKPQ